MSAAGGSLGSLPRPDTAADAGGFTLLSNPPFCCSREWLPGRELMLSPLPRRGSRFWGRAEGTVIPFCEVSRPFGARTEYSKPPAAELELWLFRLLSSVLPSVTTRVGVKSVPVGTSLSEKSGKQGVNVNW